MPLHLRAAPSAESSDLILGQPRASADGLKDLK